MRWLKCLMKLIGRIFAITIATAIVSFICYIMYMIISCCDILSVLKIIICGITCPIIGMMIAICILAFMIWAFSPPLLEKKKEK